MIPKVIHYCWFGGKELPADVKKCISSWKKYAPDFEIVEWNEANFDVNSNPFTKSAYENKAWAFVSDYVRLYAVYTCGGIYLDTDIELLKPLDDLLDMDFFISVQQSNHLPTTGLGYGACKENRIVKEMLSKYEGIVFSEETKNDYTCPKLNSKVIFEHGYVYCDEVWKTAEITVFPSRYFDPLSPGKTQNLLCDDTYSIHHYAASWTSGKNRFKRRIFRAIGEDRVHAVKEFLRWNIKKNEV